MKFFISHSSKDVKYGNALVRLLLDVGVPSRQIIFTSKPGYGIPTSMNIFEWLRNSIKENPYVIYLLSDNYYSSVACLNEMGAAWIVGNDYISLFEPEFDIENPKFQNGAVDPRKLGAFIDNKDQMLGFINIIIQKSRIEDSNLNIINDAITNYIKSINEIKINLNNNKKTGKSFSSDININGSDKEIEQKPVLEVENESYFEEFIGDIQNYRLSDEEFLLIMYMIDSGKKILGTGWKEEGEIVNIKQWEEVKNLNSTLSIKYSAALGKLELRKYMEVHSKTSHGNPRDYILIEEISKNLMKLSEELMNQINEKMRKHLASNSVNDLKNDTLPF